MKSKWESHDEGQDGLYWAFMTTGNQAAANGNTETINSYLLAHRPLKFSVDLARKEDKEKIECLKGLTEKWNLLSTLRVTRDNDPKRYLEILRG